MELWSWKSWDLRKSERMKRKDVLRKRMSFLCLGLGFAIRSLVKLCHVGGGNDDNILRWDVISIS